MHPHLYVERKERHLKQKDVAEMLNINPITYHRKETGKTVFTLPEALFLADLFGVTVEKLFSKKVV